MDWSGWALFGLLATVALSVVMTMAQLGGLTRMDLPLLLGTIFVEDPDRARVVGFFVHLANGQVFAFFYAATFALAGSAGMGRGAALGLLHALVALTLLMPMLPGVHPHMASSRAGPGITGAHLEPPGLLGLNYGRQTAIVAVASHLVYGAALGVLLSPS